jgi:DNA helicase-2/ATP-dependent DNA helicase PcrA
MNKNIQSGTATFKEAYAQLNKEQKQAVDTIDGPVMVLAGPGTGKTQLLSTRVANILAQTDMQPHNILCLTFTESGAQNMRERLTSIIGQAAQDIAIHTYHSFGSSIIASYPEFFESIQTERSDDTRMEHPIDELEQISIVSSIINDLPFGNPLLNARYYARDVISTISELKQALIDPKKLHSIAAENLETIKITQTSLDDILNSEGGISRKKAVYLVQYQSLLAELAAQTSSLARMAAQTLEAALAQATEDNSSKPLTAWKNDWLHKDAQDNFVFTRPLDSQKLQALADVYSAYNKHLREHNMYDFNDMILRTINALQTEDELRFNVQERYQYVLLDEFQDTNLAQFELIKEIANHPVHEGRPNILAVGDDDQAIYAFQGAHVGNMHDFMTSFSDVAVINLTKNYRSHAHILETAHNVAAQIEDRLHTSLPSITKTLQAEHTDIADSLVERREFNAQASEYGWVGSTIADCIAKGVNPKNIAVFAPKHQLLEELVPFIHKHNVPVSYEKRENILTTPIVSGLRLAAQLVDALQRKDIANIHTLFPQVVSLPFWKVTTTDIWRVNWQLQQPDESRSWPEIALDSSSLSDAVQLYLSLGNMPEDTPLEYMLDYMIGVTDVAISSSQHITSPLKEHYFSHTQQNTNTSQYIEGISHLSVIRTKIRDQQRSKTTPATLQDFLQLFSAYEDANQQLRNTHPLAQADNAVQLMTAFKAKGLEFEHVFIVSAHNDVWGSKTRRQYNKLAMPPNMRHIRYMEVSEDERKRLLYVAITRAQKNLHITSHTTKDSGRATEPAAYLLEADGTTQILPSGMQNVHYDTSRTEQLQADTATLWESRHLQLDAPMRAMITERLERYRLSPTHLNTFIDTERGGPATFFIQTILRFPQAPSIDGEFGTAIHNTLEWLQNQHNKNTPPSPEKIAQYFKTAIAGRFIPTDQQQKVIERGVHALSAYTKARTSMFTQAARSEVNFAAESVHIEGARISGKIDRLEINEQDKTIAIADYKTGAAFTSWRTGSDLKHLKYEQQLYMYKLLVEGSHSFAGYRVTSARLEFVEPDNTGVIPPALHVTFTPEKEAELRALIPVIWQHIQDVDMPAIDQYKKNASGAHAFIADLLV